MHQGSMFDDPSMTGRQAYDAAEADAKGKPRRPIKARDPNIKPMDTKAAEAQNAKILERLQRGPVAIRELVLIAAKYTSRISDLRELGCVIKNYRDPETRESTYVLVKGPE